MNEQRWVWHISGKGEKWPVVSEHQLEWVIAGRPQQPYYYRLPKSEYALCEPPLEWEDVTAECEVDYNDWNLIRHNGVAVQLAQSYRLRKVNGGSALIVEKIVEKKVNP